MTAIRHLKSFCLVVFVLANSACASFDFDYPKQSSVAITDTEDTSLGRYISGEVISNDGKSGFYPLVDGIDALATRLSLADRAERSIDAQYFLITDDLVGHLFLESLLRAADRGVRVRLLVDDIHTEGADAGLAALDSHDNVEVRLYNPFGHRTVRAFNAASLGRVVRRMHNKSFTVDSQMTVIGGRNIADEYFDGRQDVKFRDLDVLAIGPIAKDVSSMFDIYWNHMAALPVPAVASVPDDPDAALTDLQQTVARTRAEVADSKYEDAIDHSISVILHQDLSVYTWASYELVFDSPDKTFNQAEGKVKTIMDPLRKSVGHAEKELLVLSPYVVLREPEIEGFRDLRDKGVDITIVTNSLASNNHGVSHSGYAPTRKPLVEMGVNLYELKADASVPGDVRVGIETAKSTLHAKAFVVDRERLFIGSFNWNQRSENVDTEMGVIIESRQLADDFATRISRIGSDQSFEVIVNDAGKIRWIEERNGETVTLEKEPHTSFWQRFSAAFLSKLPIKGQL